MDEAVEKATIIGRWTPLKKVIGFMFPPIQTTSG